MKVIDTEIINKLKSHLLKADGQIVIVPHVNPDGDAIGSALGLARVLKNSGANVQVVSPTNYPNFYNWIVGNEDVIVHSSHKKKAKSAVENTKLLICLDFNHLSRAGDLKESVESYKGPSVLIDHHPNPQAFTELMISHPECSSTAELVFQVVKLLGLQQFVDKDAAEAFFCGIMTDTGSFDYNVSDPQTFQTISELLELGINQEAIHSRVYDNYSADRMRLMGYCLSECMEVYPEYHAAMIYLTKEVQKKFNFVPGDSESFVNLPLSIKGVHFSTLFTEKDDQVKASFRSKGEFAVNEFAGENFNGGGHRNAAGGEVKTSLKETLDLYRSLLPAYQDKLVKTNLDY
ncbi:DHH family phosphoesterase [Sunxiuqinia sp. A32]|uniref:DHH family phosphoesterase n=1 Tax=Sunxiuqinia sp. A32 TaxID=3461496 RepID=UPI0040457911